MSGVQCSKTINYNTKGSLGEWTAQPATGYFVEFQVGTVYSVQQGAQCSVQ